MISVEKASKNQYVFSCAYACGYICKYVYVLVCVHVRVCVHMHTYLRVLPFRHGENSLVQLEPLLSESSCHSCNLISFVQNG